MPQARLKTLLRAEDMFCFANALPADWLARFPILGAHNHYSGYLAEHLKRQITLDYSQTFRNLICAKYSGKLPLACTMKS